MLAQEEYEGSTRFEETGMVNIGYCPPCGERPKNGSGSLVGGTGPG